jgi:hypothetical protein
MAMFPTLKFVPRLAALVAVGATFACAAKEEAPPPPEPKVVTIRASDFAFTMPAEVPAGFTTFQLVNDGPNLHHMIVARLDSGKTLEDAKMALANPGPLPVWLVPVGGPNAPDPNSQSNATLDLKAGDYVAFCMVDVPGGVPHATKGMISGLKVVPSSEPTAAAPTADVEIAMSDYVFGLSKQLTAGPHTIAVTTNPGQPHELEIIKFAPGKTMDDFMKGMEAMMAGKPLAGPMAASAIGGVSPAIEGTTQYFTVDLTPGEYALLCFMPDRKDGKMHLQHGMVQQIVVP